MMRFPIGIYKVRDRSMEPSFHDGDYVVVNSWARSFKVGDVVIAEHPKGKMLLLKRVKRADSSGYFLVGDNAASSTDSRHFGYLQKSRLIGKVVAKV